MRKLIYAFGLTSALVFALAAHAAAPNFAGTWTLDKSKSQGLNQRLQNADSVTWNITQTDKDITIEEKIAGGGGPGGPGGPPPGAGGPPAGGPGRTRAGHIPGPIAPFLCGRPMMPPSSGEHWQPMLASPRRLPRSPLRIPGSPGRPHRSTSPG